MEKDKNQMIVIVFSVMVLLLIVAGFYATTLIVRDLIREDLNLPSDSSFMVVAENEGDALPANISTGHTETILMHLLSIQEEILIQQKKIQDNISKNDFSYSDKRNLLPEQNLYSQQKSHYNH